MLSSTLSSSPESSAAVEPAQERPSLPRVATDFNSERPLQPPAQEGAQGRTVVASPDSAGGSTGSRHHRAQSMNEPEYHSPSPTSPPDLVRRHHTLSTSSRLVRLERSRARIALQDVGLSEQDRAFYVPESPIDGPAVSAWSDLGHTAAARGLSSLGAHQRTASAGSSNFSASTSGGGGGPDAWRGAESESPAQFVAATAPFLPQRDAPSAATFEHSPPGPFVPKRSSFVVLRGGKGDAELTERRAAATAGTDPLSPRTTLRNITPPRPNLEHRNSLKPFLEADGEDPGDQEEWERGLQDERARELSRAAEDQRPSHFAAPFTTPSLSQSAAFSSRGSPFNSAAPHTRSNTLSHTQSIASITSSDAWNGGGLEDVGVLRRHHSLDFRSDGGHGNESSSDEGWSNHGHDRQAISEDLLSQHGHSLGGFANSRPGTGPPSLNLSQHGGLSHSSSLNSHRGSLSHSNSLNSSSHHSHSGHSGALSPVGGFPRSPWSPTVEETKQLGMGAVVGTPPHAVVMPTLSRGGSTSSRGSSGGRYATGDDVARLGDDMAALDVAATPDHHEQSFAKPPTPPGIDIRAAVQNHAQAAYGGGPNKGGDVVGQLRQPVRSMTTGNAISPNRRLPPLMTNPDVLASLSGGNQPAPANSHPQPPSSFVSRQGPASAAAYVPPIGHSHPSRGDFLPSISEPSRGNFTAAPGGGGSDWTLKKEVLIGGAPASAFPNAVGVNPLADAWPAGGGFGVGLAMQQQQQIQILQSQMQAALQAMDMMKAQGHSLPPGYNSASTPVARPFSTFPAGGIASAGVTPTAALPQANSDAPADSPIDIQSLVATKGYNPQNFDLRPPSARFFVIKSYTEEDVHKSLKYEIWASTDLGNKRLDRAFRESADKGPIYLFFSVNGSGHFAGMAQMLTPVDYAMSSNVWASDKWKGVLKVKWIYIKDVPLASLRHIRLSNTPENKPVTSSRDTQEVPYDAGLAVLGILASYNARTSLLQDFAYYNSIAIDNPASAQGQQQTKPAASAPHQSHYTPRPSPEPSYQPPQQQQHFQYQQDPHQMSNHGPPPYPNFRPDMSQQQPVAQGGGGGRRFYGQGNGAPGGY